MVGGIARASEEAVRRMGELDLAGTAKLVVVDAMRQTNPRRMTRKVVDDVCRVLVGDLMADAVDGVRERPQESYNAREVPIIPIKGGKGWDIRTHKLVDADAVAECHYLEGEHAWSIPEPREDANPPSWMVRHFVGDGRFAPLIDRTATLLLATARTVDVITQEDPAASKIGKSLFPHVISEAFKTAIAKPVDASRVYGKGSARFTGVELCLAGNLIVYVDEVDKMVEKGLQLDGSSIHQLTPFDVHCEPKGVQGYTVRRMGTAVFVGAEPPPCDFTAQGVAERIGWAHIFPEGLEPIGDEPGRKMAADAELHAFVQMEVLKAAHNKYMAWKQFDLNPWERDAEVSQGAIEMVMARSSALREGWSLVLDAVCVPDPEGKVTSRDLRQALGEHPMAREMGRVPSGWAMHNAISAAFGARCARNRSVRTPGESNPVKGYTGFRLRASTDE